MLSEWIFMRRPRVGWQRAGYRDGVTKSYSRAPVRATLLTPADAAEARALLARDPITNLFLIDKLDTTGFVANRADRWVGVRDPSHRLAALAYTARQHAGRPADTTVLFSLQ